MSDLWGSAIVTAVNHDTLLRASELEPHMVIRHVRGDRLHRVIEVLVGPDGFQGQGIFRTIDEKGYDHTFLFAYDGKQDDPVWILQGRIEGNDTVRP